jgi:hypothetical protein
VGGSIKVFITILLPMIDIVCTSDILIRVGQDKREVKR